MKAEDIVLGGIYLGRTFSPRQVIGFDIGPKGAKRVQYRERTFRGEARYGYDHLSSFKTWALRRITAEEAQEILAARREEKM